MPLKHCSHPSATEDTLRACTASAPAAGVGRTEEEEGKAMEAKHMKGFGPAEGFWASPEIT